jgi:hypothetical protein
MTDSYNTFKLGDWCWFYNTDMSIPVFDMFEKVTSKGKYKSLHSHGIQDCRKWDQCEPFIGTLPAKLKANHGLTNS